MSVFDLDDIYKGITGETAADASREAAQTAAASGQQALDYLKETEAVPQQFREAALQRLGGLFGLEGGTGESIGQFDQQAAIDAAMQSPLYQAIMGTQQAGEEAVLRQASATGGLRSGNVQSALADQARQLEQQALLQSYNQQVEQDRYGQQQMLAGLGALTGTASLTPQIAQTMQNIGMTQAQGITGAAQAQQQGVGNLLQIGALAFSDIRLKKNIKPHCQKNGVNFYSWEWNEKAAELGLKGYSIGVMAHEMPESALILDKSGYLVVDYTRV